MWYHYIISFNYIISWYHILEDVICVFQPKGNTAEGQELKLRDDFMQKLGGMARYRRCHSLFWKSMLWDIREEAGVQLSLAK